jgi:hypothetical protein
VFENRVLRRILGPKMEELIESWRKFHDEELHDFCSSPNVVRVIKSRRMRWAEHVTRMTKMRNRPIYKSLVAKTNGKSPLGAGGRIILKLILKK